jgi:hypothetical protein
MLRCLLPSRKVAFKPSSMYKGDKHRDARYLCGRDHGDAFPLSGGLLSVDSSLKWSAANRRAGELLR